MQDQVSWSRTCESTQTNLFFVILSFERKNQYLRTDCAGSQVDEGVCPSGYGVPEEVKNSFIWFYSSVGRASGC